MDFKEKGIERAKKYVLEVNTKEMLNHTLPNSDVLISEACFDDYTSGYNQALKDSKAPEMLEMLEKAKTELSRIKNSMRAHPDCTEGSEFDDYTSSAEECENNIEQLIKQTTGLCKNT